MRCISRRVGRSVAGCPPHAPQRERPALWRLPPPRTTPAPSCALAAALNVCGGAARAAHSSEGRAAARAAGTAVWEGG